MGNVAGTPQNRALPRREGRFRSGDQLLEARPIWPALVPSRQVWCKSLSRPGGYRFKDYLKVGITLNYVILGALLLVLPIFWPLCP